MREQQSLYSSNGKQNTVLYCQDSQFCLRFAPDLSISSTPQAMASLTIHQGKYLLKWCIQPALA